MNGPLIDASGRVRDLEAERRHRQARTLRGIAIGFVVFVVIAWIIAWSPLFAVRQIVVQGNTRTATDAIVAASGVGRGTPLLRVDAPSAQAGVAAIPGIARADVTTTFPDKLTITVVDAAPSFTMEGNGGFVWVDSDGQLFGVTKNRPDKVPLAAVKNGGDRQTLADVATLAGALPPRLQGHVKQINADSRLSMSVATTEGATISWGDASNSALKGQIADVLVNSAPTCKQIDVSSPSNPTTKC